MKFVNICLWVYLRLSISIEQKRLIPMFHDTIVVYAISHPSLSVMIRYIFILVSSIRLVSIYSFTVFTTEVVTKVLRVIWVITY